MQANQIAYSQTEVAGAGEQVEKEAFRALSEWEAKIKADRRTWLRLLDKADEQITMIDALLQELPCEQSNPVVADSLLPNGIQPLISDDGPVSCEATVEDIRGCPSQRAAARIIAEKSGGEIHLNSAAKAIHAAGLAKGRVKTINSSLHSFMTNSDEWEYVRENTFRLVEKAKTVEPME